MPIIKSEHLISIQVWTYLKRQYISEDIRSWQQISQDKRKCNSQRDSALADKYGLEVCYKLALLSCNIKKKTPKLSKA